MERVKHRSSSKPRRISKDSNKSDSSDKRRVKRGSKPRKIIDSGSERIHHSEPIVDKHREMITEPRRIRKIESTTPKQYNEETDIEQRKKLEHAKYEEKYGIELDDSDVLRIKNKRAQFEKPLTETGAKVQDKDEIKKFLEGYKKLDTNELGTLSCGSFIRYIKPDGVLCKGGLLTKNCYPKYWMLTNSKLKKTWSVQLQSGYKYYTVDKEKQLAQRTEADQIYNQVKNREVDMVPRGELQTIMDDYYRMKKLLGEV
jgi:hypothetical protein